MSLKDTIESHPLKILSSVVLAVAATTAGVVTYVLDSKDGAERTRLEAEYKSDAIALKTRLASIERKLGSDEKKYFDVSELVITPDRVKSLDSAFKSAGDGQFFYAVPVGQAWKYKLISEYELLERKVTIGKDHPLSQLAGPLGEKNLHLWASEQVFRIRPRPRTGLENMAPAEIRFFPLVSVQIVNERQFTAAVGHVHKILSQDADAARITRRLDELSSGADTVARDGGNAAGPVVAKSRPGSADAAVLADRRIEAEAQLQGLFRGDVAAVMLVGMIQQGYQLSQIFQDTQLELTSVQKKGNVLYARAAIRFIETPVVGQDKPVSLTVDREFFLVTSPKNVYLVTVEVPTVDGRSDAYAWVGQWLSGIRIPL